MASRLLAALLSSAILAGCATTQQQASAPAAAAPAVTAAADQDPSPHDRLFELFKASDEASLQRNPLNAIFRGDLRFADRFGDYITDEYYAAERAAAQADLA